MLSEPVRIQLERVGVCSHPREGGLRRLLHHVAELPGDRQASLAGIRGRLEEEYVAADCGECEPGCDTGVGGTLAHLALVAPGSEPGTDLPLVDA